MANVLILSDCPPVLSHDPAKQRIGEFVKFLAADHKLYLGAKTEDAPLIDIAAVEACAGLSFEPLAREGGHEIAAEGNAALALPVRSGAPGSLSRWVHRALTSLRLQTIYATSPRMAQHIPVQNHRAFRLVVEFKASDLEGQERANRPSAAGSSPVRASAMLRRAALNADIAVVTSEREAKELSRLVPEAAKKIRIVPNGVVVPPHVPSHDPERARGIAYWGPLDDSKIADSLVWFASEVMPVLRRRDPRALFRIAGPEATLTVRRLGERPDVVIMEGVNDPYPVYDGATLAVFPHHQPTDYTEGLLEALATGTPVAATQEALASLPRAAVTSISTASTPAGFADLYSYYSDRKQAVAIGNRELGYVEDCHDWEDLASQLSIALGLN